MFHRDRVRHRRVLPHDCRRDCAGCRVLSPLCRSNRCRCAVGTAISGYIASKCRVRGLTRAAALELGWDGIRSTRSIQARSGLLRPRACWRIKPRRRRSPTTCGKVERFQQTLKNWLRANQFNHPRSTNCRPSSTSSPTLQPSAPAPSLPHEPPRRRLHHPPQSVTDRQPRHRHPRPDPPRPRRRLRRRHRPRRRPPHHIGIGRPTPEPRLLLAHDLHIRVVNAVTGELLRELVPTPAATTSHRAPKGPHNKTQPNPIEGSAVCRCLETLHWSGGQDLNLRPLRPEDSFRNEPSRSLSHTASVPRLPTRQTKPDLMVDRLTRAKPAAARPLTMDPAPHSNKLV